MSPSHLLTNNKQEIVMKNADIISKANINNRKTTFLVKQINNLANELFEDLDRILIKSKKSQFNHMNHSKLKFYYDTEIEDIKEEKTRIVQKIGLLQSICKDICC